MKVLILYANVGNGHLKAAQAIAEEIKKEHKDVEVVLEDGMEYSGGLTNKLIVKGYMGMIKYIPSMWDNIYKKADKVNRSALLEVYNLVTKYMTIRLKKIFRRENPDIIIITHPFICKMATYLKKKKKTNAKIHVIVTDYQIHKFWIIGHEIFDKMYLAMDYMKKDCELYGVEKEKIVITGIPISKEFLQEYNREEILKYFNLKDKKTILFFGGGGTGVGKTQDMFKKLLEYNYDYQIIAVAGNNEKQKKVFENLAKKSNKEVLVLGFTNKVPELMYITDFVVTKPGGLTVTECLVMKKPLIIIKPIPGHEEKNSNFLLNNGAALRAYDVKSLDDVLDIVFKDSSREEQMVKMCEKLSKPNSTKDIVDEIFK